MKKGFLLNLIALSIGLFSAFNIHAQDTTTVGQDIKKIAKETGKVAKKSAKKVGNKTAELASKGKAGVVDKIYDGKQGPNGQTIYINNKAKYYWIDKQGHKRFITEGELKDKKG